MNAERLLKHFDRIAEAPGAVPRLREFVLDSAVRGKLTSQRKDEGSGASLLERIAQERGSRADGPRPIRVARPPFQLPAGWCWSCIGDICSKTGSGSTPRGGKAAYRSEGVAFLRSQNVYNDGLRLEEVAYIDPATHQRMAGTKVMPNDLLLNITGGSMGRCCLVSSEVGEANVSQHVAILRAAIPELAAFLHLLVLSPYFQGFIFDEQTGAGRGGLPKNRMDKILVALPSLSEQRRIVAKVDELMSLCDRLEAANREVGVRRARAVSRSFHAAVGGGQVRAHRSSNLDILTTLITRSAEVRSLRSAIREMCIQGLLSGPADGDDDSGVTIDRIKGDRAKLTDAPRISSTTMPRPPFEIPPHWRWVAMGLLVEDADSGWSPRCETFARSGDAWGVLKVSAVSWDRFLPEENKQLVSLRELPRKAQIRRGDFLISRANTSDLVAKCVIVAEDPDNLILSDKVVRLRLTRLCDARFIAIVNNHASYARRYYATEASGTSPSMKNVSRSVIYALPIPFPPLAEQRRIVARVGQLMALCDGFEAQLARSEQESSRFLEAVLREALADETATRSGPSSPAVSDALRNQEESR